MYTYMCITIIYNQVYIYKQITKFLVAPLVGFSNQKSPKTQAQTSTPGNRGLVEMVEVPWFNPPKWIKKKKGEILLK